VLGLGGSWFSGDQAGHLGRSLRSSGSRSAAPLQYTGLNLAITVGAKLLVAAVGRVFAVFVDVFDYALEDEQVWGALAG
jgi:hypothetical protein